MANGPKWKAPVAARAFGLKVQLFSGGMTKMNKPHVVYFLKAPGGTRRTFSLVKRTVQNGQRQHETVEHERVRALNAAVIAGVVPAVDARFQLKDLVTFLNKEELKKRKGSYVASSANLKLLEKYWDAEYSHKHIRQYTAKRRLLQAVDALGPVALLGGRSEVQAALDNACKGAPRRQRKLAASLNQIRKYFGVNERLSLVRKTRPKFSYLTEAQLNKVLQHVEDERLRALFTVLFYSGLRTGEAFACSEHHLRREVLMVDGQVLRDGNEGPTKSGAARRTLLLKPAHKAFAAWVSAEKGDINRFQLSRVLKKACEKAKVTPVCVHDLRHSFAVMMLVEYGCTVSAIAKMLGNRTDVCEDYYLNFIPEDEVLMSVLKKTRGSHGTN